MPNLSLTVAMGDYDHTRDLLDGRVRAEGIDVTALRLPVEEIFYRFTTHREWQVSEMSFAKTVALRSLPDPDIVVLPVFPSRAFRHSSIYVRAGSGIDTPAQLAGKRVGIPEWAQTAAIWTRGQLMHEYGVDLASIAWHQAGVNERGRAEKVKLHLPPGLSCTPVPERSLSEMLVEGSLDAVLSARPPAPFVRGDPGIRRLFPDYRDVEAQYWNRTSIFPIMHVVAVRRDTYERNRWIAANLVRAFSEAKDRSLARLADITASAVPLPWVADAVARSREKLGADFWPYGIEPNRVTLDAFLQYAAEQGVTRGPLALDSLFAPETMSHVKV